MPEQQAAGLDTERSADMLLRNGGWCVVGLIGKKVLWFYAYDEFLEACEACQLWIEAGEILKPRWKVEDQS